MTFSLLGFVKKYWYLFVIAVVLILGFGKVASPQSQNKLAIPQRSMIGSSESVYPGTDSDYSPVAPVLDAVDRMVVETSTLSLLVKDVRQSQNDITAKTEELGGYMVSSQVYSPEGAENGVVTVRVPSENGKQAIAYFRSIGVKVVSENLVGQDVTDQYTDIKSRMETLETAKAKLEAILEKATVVTDILSAQREIINVQSQIDLLKGRVDYLEKTSQSVKITVSLSTDELSLPYAPSEAWRPKVVFKNAIRSLIGSARSVGSGLIWIGVYGAVLTPVLVVIYLLKRKTKKIS
jgi:uncharacterized coiled-coil protein SlyX